MVQLSTTVGPSASGFVQVVAGGSSCSDIHSNTGSAKYSDSANERKTAPVSSAGRITSLTASIDALEAKQSEQELQQDCSSDGATERAKASQGCQEHEPLGDVEQEQEQRDGEEEDEAEEEERWYPDPATLAAAEAEDESIPLWLRSSTNRNSDTAAPAPRQATLAMFAPFTAAVAGPRAAAQHPLSRPGARVCGLCGVLWDPAAAEDAARHAAEHGRYDRGVPFAGWKKQITVPLEAALKGGAGAMGLIGGLGSSVKAPDAKGKIVLVELAKMPTAQKPKVRSINLPRRIFSFT